MRRKGLGVFAWKEDVLSPNAVTFLGILGPTVGYMHITFLVFMGKGD